MNKSTLLLVLLLTLFGTSRLHAATLSEGFEDVTLTDADGNALANTWSYGYGLSNGWKVIGGSIYSSAGNANYGLWTTAHTGKKSLEASYSASNAASVVISQRLTGTLTFWARKTSSSSNTKGTVKLLVAEPDGSTYTITAKQLYSNTSLTTTWTQYSVDLGDEGVYVAINLIRAAIDDIEAEVYEEAAGPKFIVRDGTTRLTSPYTYNFGLTEAGTEKAFTIANPGTADLAVSVAETGDFGATLSATTIAAGEEATLTVAMPAVSGSSTVTVTPEAEGLEPFVLQVSGAVKDPNKVFVDFADGQLPTDWVTTASNTYYDWSLGEGYIGMGGTSASYGGTLTSPRLTFAAGETVAFETARYGTSTWYTPSVAIQYSTDGTTWETIATFTDDVYGTWTSRAVTIPVEGVRYIRFSGWYFYLTNIYGGEVPEEPLLRFSAEDYSFGMVGAATTTAAYTIRNSGRATLTGLKVESDNTHVVVSDVPATLAADESTTFTVTLLADAAGAQRATVAVSADGFEAVTFAVSGYVLDTDAYTATFATLPDGWENTGWSFGSGYATGGYTSATTSRNAEMTSPAITVNSGDVLAIEAQGTSNYAELRLYTSADDGATWSLIANLDEAVRAATNDFTVLTVGGVPAGDYRLKVEGYAVRVRTLNGYQLNMNAPAMSVTPDEAATFGKVTADATKTYTVANTGTGLLTVGIASDNEAFTVSPATLADIAGGESATFTVTFHFDETDLGEKSTTITVTPAHDAAAAVAIAATAVAKDPYTWEEDFEDGDIPAYWTNNGWTISTSNYGNNGTRMAFAGTTNGTYLTTPRLLAAEGDVLTFEVGGADSTDPLYMQYSADKETWSEAVSYTAAGTTTFTAPADGYYFLRFTGRFASVDNFSGFRLALPDHDVSIAAATIPATGSQYAPYTATVTVREGVGKDEEVTATLYIGDQAVATETATVAANGSTVITLTFTPEEAVADAEARIVVAYAYGATTATDAVVLTIAAAPVLDEATGTLDGFENWGSYPVVTLRYTLREGWNTIVLPFAVSDVSVFGEGAEAYELSSFSDGTLHFTITSALAAQMPYVIYAPEAKEELRFTDVTNFRTSTSADDLRSRNIDGITLQGTYAPVAAPDLAGSHLITVGGALAAATEESALSGFRAYLSIPSGTTVTALSFDGGVATGVRGMDNGQWTMDNGQAGAVYDLSGRKMNDKQASRLRSGIYIVNGRKVLKK